MATRPRSDGNSLAIAARALRGGDRDAALEALLEVWRARRAPELADLVEALGAAVDARRPPFSDAGHPSAQRAWVAALEAASGAADLGPLYAALLDTRPTLASVRLALLRGRPPDPRLATLLARALREIPFPGKGGRGFFGEAIRQLEAIDDPRFHEELREAARAHAARTVLGLRRVGQVVVKALVSLGQRLEDRPPPPPLDAGDRASVDELRRLLAPTETQRASARTGDDLLAAIYADPDDDAPRLVYADWLQQRGDPRGELITLQCLRGRDGVPSRRERQLLRQSGEAWIGELAPFVLKSGRVFRRGFLAVCRFRSPFVRHRPAELPAWATIEEIDLSAHVFVRGAYELISAPHLRALRVVRGLSGDDLIKLCRHRRPLSIESIHLRHGLAARVIPALERARALPRLRELDLTEVQGVTAELAEALRARLGLVTVRAP